MLFTVWVDSRMFVIYSETSKDAQDSIREFMEAIGNYDYMYQTRPSTIEDVTKFIELGGKIFK